MDDGDAIVGQQLAHAVEVGLVVVDPHMLEHADRDDALEGAGHVAVVLQLELDDLAETFALGALAGERELLVRQRDARHMHVGGLGEIEAHAAPARADVEHALAVLEGELGRKVPLLGELGGVEIVAAGLEIGAGILPVAIEEEIVDRRRDVVVVLDVAARAARRVELLDAARDVAQHIEPAHPARQPLCLRVLEHQLEELVDAAFFENEAAVHVAFADAHAGVEGDGAFGLGVGDPGDHPAAGAVAEAEQLALVVVHAEVAFANHPLERNAKRTEHDCTARIPPPLGVQSARSLL